MENTCKRNSIINFNTVLKQIIKIIKLNLQNEKEKIKELILNTMSPKIEGYVYCIYNDLYNLYEEPIYKIGNAKNVNRRLQGLNCEVIGRETKVVRMCKGHGITRLIRIYLDMSNTSLDIRIGFLEHGR